MTRGRASEGLLYFFLVALGIAGVLSPTQFNVLPAGGILEVVFFVCATLAIRVPKKSVLLFFCGALIYVGGSLALMVLFQPSNYLDFAQTYKAFIYVAPLCIFYKSNTFDRKRALLLLKLVLLLFAVKYFYSIALNITPRMGSRPGLYVENNFEIIFLILLFYVLRFDFGRSLSKWFGLLVLIVVASGSRSSMLALLVMFAGVYLTKISLRTFFYTVGLAALGGTAVAVFLTRSEGGGIETIDRYRFMMVFVYEVSNWPFWKFFTGNFPITPLSPESCKVLIDYQRLFSFSDDGSCYSVILHSYFLRAVLDHGLVGLAFLFGFIAHAMRGAGYSKIDAAVVLGVISASALSVSAVNSIFVSLALAIAFGLRPTHADPRCEQR